MLTTFCHLIYPKWEKKEKRELSKYKLITNEKKSNVIVISFEENDIDQSMDHSHPNYFLPFDAASYFDTAAVTYNPYTDLYSHPSSGTSSSAGTTSYHSMYRNAPTTLRHPSSFYSATMQSKRLVSLVGKPQSAQIRFTFVVQNVWRTGQWAQCWAISGYGPARVSASRVLER